MSARPVPPAQTLADLLRGEAFKGVVWPREVNGMHVYAIVGALVTDRPIEGLDPNETILCGEVRGLSAILRDCARGKATVQLGTANAVLTSLNYIQPIDPTNERGTKIDAVIDILHARGWPTVKARYTDDGDHVRFELERDGMVARVIVSDVMLESASPEVIALHVTPDERPSR